MNLSASALNDSLMTLPETAWGLDKTKVTFPVSHWVQVYMPVSGVILWCITTVVLSEWWTLRGQTHPAPAVWVCPLQCQAFFLSFCVGMLDPLCRCYKLQRRWGHHIPSGSLQVLRTQGSDLAGNLQQFLFHSWFWNTHMQSLQEENWFLREYFFFLNSNHRAFLQWIAKSILGAGLLLLTFLVGQNRQLNWQWIVSRPRKKRRERYSKWDRQMRDRWKRKSFLVLC